MNQTIISELNRWIDDHNQRVSLTAFGAATVTLEDLSDLATRLYNAGVNSKE